MSVFGTRFAAFFLPSGRIFAAFRRGLPGEQASFTASAGQQTCPFGAVAAGLGGGSLLAGAAHGLLLVAEVEEKADGEQGDGRACDVGRHLSYSCSSSMKALKAEPFYFTDSEAYGCFAVGRKSVHHSFREGIGIVRKQQMLYLVFNAFQDPNFSLVTVYLQLPFLEDIRFLKGIYLVPDYNMNPIARRIVLVKRSDTYLPEDFASMEARLILPDELTEEETLIYNYTCGKTDYIKMCTLPSPKLDLRDLQAEKKLPEKEEEYC